MKSPSQKSHLVLRLLVHCYFFIPVCMYCSSISLWTSMFHIRFRCQTNYVGTTDKIPEAMHCIHYAAYFMQRMPDRTHVSVMMSPNDYLPISHRRHAVRASFGCLKVPSIHMEKCYTFGSYDIYALLHPELGHAWANGIPIRSDQLCVLSRI